MPMLRLAGVGWARHAVARGLRGLSVIVAHTHRAMASKPSSSMTKSRLIQRLAWYYPAELSGAVAFSCYFLVALALFPLADALVLLYGLFVLSFILWQGQYYWKLKLRSLKGAEIQQDKSLRIFRAARSINRVLIGMIPLVIALQLHHAGWKISSKSLWGWGVAANLMGVLEHINYYVRQLMIDNKYDIEYLRRNKRLKIPSLAKDLRTNKL